MIDALFDIVNAASKIALDAMQSAGCFATLTGRLRNHFFVCVNPDRTRTESVSRFHQRLAHGTPTARKPQTKCPLNYLMFLCTRPLQDPDRIKNQCKFWAAST